MKERLREILAARHKMVFSTSGVTLAAVLVPIFLKEDEQYHVLFTKRTEMVQQHRGEVSFPGGAFEAEDGSLRATALRETAEEIGLSSSQIEILGELDNTPTNASGYLIYPFLGIIPYPHELHLDPWETQEVFEAPVLDLLDTRSFREEIRIRDGKPTSVYYYQYRDRVIWGATARILRQFLEVYKEAVVQEGAGTGLPVPPVRLG